MAVQTDGTGTKYVKWTAPSGVVGLTSKSILIWYYHLANEDGGTLYTINDGTGGDTDEYNLLVTPAGANTTVDFLAHFSTTDGVWRPTTGFLAINTLYHICITYNGSATTNDPIFYINNSAVAITELVAPSGTYGTGTTTDFYIGSNGINGTSNPNGRILSFCVYDRILSASEILDAYNSKLAIPSWRGLVFSPQLWAVKDGDAVGTIRDLISGAAGTPAGSPIGRGDDVLRIEGIN